MLRKQDSWLMPQKQHIAYAGTGAGEVIAVGIRMGLFCVIVEVPFVASSLVLLVLAVRTPAPRPCRDPK
ncbi:hypothetical protein [Streptodolium elevatio]|uniref:Uncharacterized protein n=1 Tax=Streptodolium elevatio TaxID=3157996 RepID=A0ABV3DJR5_9ACTN